MLSQEPILQFWNKRYRKIGQVIAKITLRTAFPTAVNSCPPVLPLWASGDIVRHSGRSRDTVFLHMHRSHIFTHASFPVGRVPAPIIPLHATDLSPLWRPLRYRACAKRNRLSAQRLQPRNCVGFCRGSQTVWQRRVEVQRPPEVAGIEEF